MSFRSAPVLLVIIGITAAQGTTSPAIGKPGTGLPLTFDVEAEIARPMADEPPGLLPVTVRLINHGDSSALIESVHVTISGGYNSLSTDIPLAPGQVKLEYMGNLWICPAGREETCTAWITYPEDMNHHNDTDVVIVHPTWQRTYGGPDQDEAQSVQQTFDGGFIIAGRTESFGAGESDVYLIKTNAQGETLWTRAYGGAEWDQGFSVQQTTYGEYIVSGWTESFGAGKRDVYLVKTNAQGDTLWTKTYGGQNDDVGLSVQQTSDRGYAIAGATLSFGAGGVDVYLIKTNSQGDTSWTRTYGVTWGEDGYSVQQTTDSGYVVVGSGSDTAGGSGVYLIKTDANGDTLWTRTFGGEYNDEGKSVQPTVDGGYIITGYTQTSVSGAMDLYLIKTNSGGDTLWTRNYGGTGDDYGNSVRQTLDSGYIVAGSTTSFGAGNQDVYLVKTNALGDTLWTRTYGGAYNDRGEAVRQTASGSYIVAGCTFSLPATDEEVYLIKTNGLLDVGPTDILSPPRMADYGTVYTPKVVVRNFGMTSGTLSVTMDIGSGYSQTIQETLVSLPFDTLVFPPWNADPVGSISITCYSSLAGDERPTNDTIRDSIQVRFVHLNDVAATAILSPPGVAESGRAYVPTAVVSSFGLNPAAFPVTMNIGTDYARTVQETLASGQCDTVVFPAWTADPLGPLDVTCFTSLVGDEDPANDTIRDPIQIVPPPHHDVGAVAILSPSGSVRAGDTVIPRARIRSFGNRVERYFDVRFRIGASYNEKVNVAVALPPGSTAELAFPPWVAEAGDWAISCSTMLGSDVDSANDKVSSSVQVVPQSLSIAPDQSDRIEAGKSMTYRFYALIQGDTGGVVAVARPSPPPGWNVRLCNATGSDDLTDTDEDGIPDLGYVAPGESGWFSLDVAAPPGTQGDTASLSHVILLVAGHVGDRPDIADTALLNLALVPTFSVHNFPNPFSGSTTFVVGLPEDGKASLTVYTRDGARVCRVLANADMPAGVHLVPWDGVNDNGRALAPGTYEYLLDYVHAGKTARIHKKLVLTKQ